MSLTTSETVLPDYLSQTGVEEEVSEELKGRN